MDYAEESLKKHYEWKGKLEIVPKVKLVDQESLSVCYTPGVARPCLEIQKNTQKSYELTNRWNTVAVITDGSAVLGLGDIGPEAAMPVMEGKCILFKQFGNVDAFPLCIRSKDIHTIVETISLLAGSFGGINLEDISAPRCFTIEKELKKRCDIPVFHDDQHGTAVVVLAALLNALKIVGKELSNIKIVISGSGAAGIAIMKLLKMAGANFIIMCDSKGIIYKGRTRLNEVTKEASLITNPERLAGSLSDALNNADVFIGVSAPGIVTPQMVKTMRPNAILFPLANPVPEIMPAAALDAGAAIVGTGRSDLPNQINNVLAFPGIFRGALDVQACDINTPMQIAAAHALADLIDSLTLTPEYILPQPFDTRITDSVSAAVKKAAIESGVALLKSANPPDTALL